MKWVNCFLAISVSIALVIFIQGFLPHKQHVTGHGQESCCRAPRFNKTVLVVVDALRTDFVTARTDSWPYLQQLVVTGQARIYNAQVHPPTVTLPRIKALISGDIPGFIDVLMNFDSAEFQEDNILYQMEAVGKSSVFYGDDTWLKLFPRSFIRSEGTTSFFVSDYTEVDENVTRHIPTEMARDDWHMMILHYLGLDHIGHLIGPSSSLLPPKLSEMDSVLRLIHSTFLRKGVKDYLIILCGDHGMADQGGHGGVTPNEVATPMVFISDVTTNQSDSIGQMYQIDLVPTLSVLLNLPIPQNSLGVVSTSVLEPLMESHDMLNALRDNSNQLYRLLQASSSYKQSAQIVSQYEMVMEQHQSYGDLSADPVRQRKLVSAYQKLLLSMRQQLASHLVDYDVTAMAYGLSMLLTALCCLYIDHPQWSITHIVILSAVALLTTSIHYTHCTSKSSSHVLCVGGLGVFSTALYTLMGASCFSAFPSILLRLMDYIKGSTINHLSALAMSLVHSLSLLSSSFIEEEHQTMYYFSTTLVLIALLSVVLTHRTSADLCSLLTVLVCMSLARKWNQTGDKWAHLPDIADLLNTPPYKNIKFVLAIVSLVVIAVTSCTLAGNRTSTAAGSTIRGIILLSMSATALYVSADCGLPSISHRAHYEANCVYWCCCILLASAVYYWYIQSYIASVYILRISWVLLTSLLHRTVNLPLMALVTTMECLLSQTILSAQFFIHLYYWMGHASFFYQGNSNSLSTADISAGYKGLSSYSPVFTAFFMLCNTYSGTIFWLISLYIQILKSEDSKQRMGDVAKMFLGYKLMDMVVLQLLIILERYHLFVWTVFAPKLVYEVLVLAIFLLYYLICNSFDPLSVHFSKRSPSIS